MREFEKQVVLITGGNSGIGKSAARLFLEQGANVWISGRDVEKTRAATIALSSYGSVHGLNGDIRVPEVCRNLVAETVQAGGGLDVLVNSAGIFQYNLGDMTEESLWDDLIDTNLKGLFFMCRYAIPHLEKSKGNIVNLSSDAGIMGNRGASVYSASKGGVNLLTKALAQELFERGIRVNAICPGDVNTPMLEADRALHPNLAQEDYCKALLERYPLGTKGPIAPEEVAQMILFIAAKKRTALNGAILSLDYGLTAGY